MVLRAVIETVGVASVLPFMAVVANPESALNNRYLRLAYDALDFGSMTAFLIFLGSASLVVLIVSNALSVLVAYMLQRFAMRQRHIIQTRLMAENLARPYESFLAANTAEIGENILKEVTEFIDGVLSPYLTLIARSVATVAILALLVVVNPLLAIATGVTLGLLYLLVFRFVRLKLKRIGAERYDVDRARYRTIAEAFSGIKDVKAAGREQTYLNAFSDASSRSSALTVTQHVINIVPKSGLEVVAFGGIVLIVLFLIGTGNNTATVLGTVTLYAFACYRLLPSLQQMYEAITQLRFSLRSLEVVESHVSELSEPFRRFDRARPIGLRESIELVDVGFTYPDAETSSLSDVNLSIPSNHSVALVGTTGSGKTTIVDLILGLFRPTEGSVKIDGRELDEELLRSWQASIGYVPQHVFLSDDTIAANIAFGVAPEDRDRAAIERAARIAQVDEFVGQLPEGLDTHIGERGVRLSGGQRQRLGIARAIYNDPAVIVLDEATSALDSVTEGAVFDALGALAGQKTVIVIAHRMTTIKDCDIIYVVDNGRISQQGTYVELMHTSAAFRALAQESLTTEQAPTLSL